MTPKRCPNCDTLKPRSEFFQNAGRADGLGGWCKTCTREYKRSPKARSQPARRKSYADNMLRHLELDPSEY